MKVIIPARGGSKRIPKKNTKLLDGVPILSHVVRELRQIPEVDEIVITTDDDDIALLANTLGLSVPFVRSSSLSTDTAGTLEVIQDAIYRLMYSEKDLVLVVYPTSIFFRHEDVRDAVALCMDGKRLVFAATAYGHPYQRGFHIENSQPRFIDRAALTARTQDLEKLYHDAGQFYLTTAGHWAARKAILAEEDVVAKVLPRVSIDIDNESDWLLAEAVHKCLM